MLLYYQEKNESISENKIQPVAKKLSRNYETTWFQTLKNSPEITVKIFNLYKCFFSFWSDLSDCS